MHQYIAVAISLFALTACGPTVETAQANLDKSREEMKDTVHAPLRAWLAERPKTCASKNLKEAEGAVLYSAQLVRPETHTLRAAMAAGDWMLEFADAAKAGGCKEAARRTYDNVLRIYVGGAYAALRQRAQVGIDDLR